MKKVIFLSVVLCMALFFLIWMVGNRNYQEYNVIVTDVDHSNKILYVSKMDKAGKTQGDYFFSYEGLISDVQVGDVLKIVAHKDVSATYPAQIRVKKIEKTKT